MSAPMGDPLHEVTTDKFRAIFMLGAGDDEESVENVDVEVIQSDGTRWSDTFLTLREIQRIMDSWRGSDESLSGSYFRCPDLVIIREPRIPAMMRALEHAVANDENSA